MTWLRALSVVLIVEAATIVGLAGYQAYLVTVLDEKVRLMVLDFPENRIKEAVRQVGVDLKKQLAK